jgi:putative peptide zinc metalloprotease protein
VTKPVQNKPEQVGPQGESLSKPDLASRIQLHVLQFRQEHGAWIVGRPETGEFVELPAEAITLLRALGGGESVRAARERVHIQHGADVDAVEFVADLVELGFVERIDDRPIDSTIAPPSLRWLRPGHLRWLFSPPIAGCVLVLMAAGLSAAVLRGNPLPSYHAYFISDWQSVNVVWNTTMFLSTLALHEFSHLAAARADGVYARIGLGTRLQFLVAQTTVSGLWGAPRRVRLRVYLAGITTDLCVASVCSLVLTFVRPTGFTYASLEALILALLLSVALEFALYMRTDMYFVLQELLRCRNLYADACDRIGYLLRASAARLWTGARVQDPTDCLSAQEQRAVRVYAMLMVGGTLVTLGSFAFFGGPILVSLLVGAAAHVAHGIVISRPLEVADGAVVLCLEGGLQILFVRLFFAKHRPKLALLVALLKGNARRNKSSRDGG